MNWKRAEAVAKSPPRWQVSVIFALWALAGNLVCLNGRAEEASNGTPHRSSPSGHELQKSSPDSVHDPKLRKELLARMAEDQEVRKQFLDLMGRQGQLEDTEKQIDLARAKMREVDGKNLARIKEIVRRWGWPGKTLVGSDGSQAAWLLVQHADSDLAFQKQCLALILVAVEKGESPAEHMAYLTDRVRVAEKRKQIYGTQFHDVGGKQEPYPIENENDVDSRRRDVGLPPMVEYRKSIEQLYRPGN